MKTIETTTIIDEQISIFVSPNPSNKKPYVRCARCKLKGSIRCDYAFYKPGHALIEGQEVVGCQNGIRLKKKEMDV